MRAAIFSEHGGPDLIRIGVIDLRAIFWKHLSIHELLEAGEVFGKLVLVP